MTPDAELIERTLQGDGDAFAALVQRHQRAVFRVAWAIVRDEGDADSVTQDTFVKAYTALPRYSRRAAFSTWLTRIAINTSRDVLRRRALVRLFTGDAPPERADSSPDAERQVLSQELRSAIERAERRLPPQQQLVFRLRHHEDFTPEAIATHLGLDSGTVRAHLFRAVRRIRRELAAWQPTKRMSDAPALQ